MLRRLFTIYFIGLLPSFSMAAEPEGPVKLRAERFWPLAMPDGSVWGMSVQALAEGRMAITTLVSNDNGKTWSDRKTLVELPKVAPPETVWSDAVPLVDKQTGDLHAFILKWDQTDKKRPFPKLSLYHLKAAKPHESWTQPQLLFDGYIGALLSAVQQADGTIVVPFAYMTERHYSKPAAGLMAWVFMGQHTSTAVYSKDGGKSFQRSNDVNIPAAIILGNEAGAVEPVCLPLKDGRIWMMIRSQLGRHWQSFSRDGVTWSEAGPSKFIASDSPASLTRLVDGRIVIIWNACMRYPYAHGGRQVLHAAISSDEGKTWKGFREVLRDPHRLEPAFPIKGDYGTAYSVTAPLSDGAMLFATGQGQTSGVFRLDPAWLEARSQRDDFQHGLEDWSAYGTKGVELVAHPDAAGNKVLKIERTDREFPAGAVWNFPNGRGGAVRIKFKLLPGNASTAITLTDHFSSPFDLEAELNGLFTATVGSSLNLGEGWHELALDWDFDRRSCRATIDGKTWKDLPQQRLASEGVNYLRFRALAGEPTPGGLLIESVSAEVR